MAGLGDYAYKTKGWKRVAVLAEDYSFPYTQVLGFMVPFCAAGGKVPEKFWVPLGTKDYSSVIAKLPQDVDAIYVALGGADAVNFLTQYQQAGGNKAADRRFHHDRPDRVAAAKDIRDAADRHAGRGLIADNWDNPRWKAFVAAYQKKFPDGLPSPSLLRTRTTWKPRRSLRSSR
jgi:branched-chain amino acid transport system substrate-binding protein